MAKAMDAREIIPFILTINGGSSSIKFALYQASEPLDRRLHGKIDRIGVVVFALSAYRVAVGRGWMGRLRYPRIMTMLKNGNAT